MKRLHEIRELFEFNAWASRRMFEATAPLSEEEFTRDLKNSFASIRDTIVHIVGAEWVWLSRWNGRSPSEIPNTTAEMMHAEIVRWWYDIEVERDAYLNALTPEALDAIIPYRNFAGVHFALPLWPMMRHQVNHSTYHRGQIMTMLKQLGHKPIPTDMILMYQERYKESVEAP